MIFIICLIALLVGGLIGTVGAGGVLLIPALNNIAHLSIHVSMGTALFSFIFTGTLGTILYQRHGSIDWKITLPICGSTLLFSYLGATANSYASGALLQFALGSIISFAGVYALVPTKGAKDIPAHCKTLPVLLGIGAFVGFASGLTGAGGPVISVPLMVLLGFPPLLSIATSQVIQITAGISGSIGNIANNTIDFRAAGLVIAFELAGVFCGAWLAHRVPTPTLKKIVAFACILVGGFVLVQSITQL